MSETSLMMVCFKFVASCSETENSGLCISGQLVELYEIRCFCELLSCVKTFFYTDVCGFVQQYTKRLIFNDGHIHI